MKPKKYKITPPKPRMVAEPAMPYGSPYTFEKVWQTLQETDRKMQETSKEVNKLAGLFTGQWGKLVESLLTPGCLKIFQEAGIKITQACANATVKKDGNTMEIDVLLINDTELVAVEVKTTAKVSHIKEILDEMKVFKNFFHQYKNYKAYAAIAALRFEENCDRYAASKGLFVLKPTGENLVKIANTKDFKPMSF